MMAETKPSEDIGETATLVKAAAAAAPHLFAFLDGDGSGSLTKAELAWLTKAEVGNC